MASTYDVGDTVRITGTWTNAAGTAIDPENVYCKFKSPRKATTKYTYDEDAALVKSATGVYYADIDVDIEGRWFYRFYSTGEGRAAGESYFEVGKSEF